MGQQQQQLHKPVPGINTGLMQHTLPYSAARSTVRSRRHMPPHHRTSSAARLHTGSAKELPKASAHQGAVHYKRSPKVIHGKAQPTGNPMQRLAKGPYMTKASERLSKTMLSREYNTKASQRYTSSCLCPWGCTRKSSCGYGMRKLYPVTRLRPCGHSHGYGVRKLHSVIRLRPCGHSHA